MLIYPTLCLVIGVLVGFRYRVFALAPIAVFVLGGAWATAASAPTIAVLQALVALQLGYLIGAALPPRLVSPPKSREYHPFGRQNWIALTGRRRA